MKKKFDSQQAIRILREKGVGKYSCVLCGGREFAVHEEIATINVTEELNTFRLGTHIPAAVLICKNCGNIQFFALGALGMMNSNDGENA